ncbi:PilN domain-containing protein [Candidatus Gottesmanbacteria bacterium]|nr:PilN domain-containing protein [Candidatus Gottesmanbacteria bacterium]
MTDINLLPGKEAKKLGKFLTWVLTYGRYIIIGTEIIVLLAFLSRFKLDRDLTDLHEGIAQKQTVILPAQDLEQQVRSLQNRLLIIKKISNQREFPPKLLSTFEGLTPVDVTLTGFSLESSKLFLTAVAFSNEGFSVFLNNLSASDYFTDISLDDVNKAKGGIGIEFKISTSLKNL